MRILLTTSEIKKIVASGDVSLFYRTYDWKRRRAEVMALDKRECQHCKAKGKYTPAKLVHHVNHLRDRPELALSIWYVDGMGVKRRQLVSLCDTCHEEQHPERMRQYKPKEHVTKEMW